MGLFDSLTPEYLEKVQGGIGGMGQGMMLGMQEKRRREELAQANLSSDERARLTAGYAEAPPGTKEQTYNILGQPSVQLPAKNRIGSRSIKDYTLQELGDELTDMTKRKELFAVYGGEVGEGMFKWSEEDDIAEKALRAEYYRRMGVKMPEKPKTPLTKGATIPSDAKTNRPSIGSFFNFFKK